MIGGTIEWGYEQYGQKYVEPAFGELTPKRKFL